MALNPGVRLGPYEVVGRLGSGGMGEVYKAIDARLHRTVAIKVLSSQVSSDQLLRQRFEREAKTLAALSHPHICPVHDVGSVDGLDYLVMEFMDGETLADRLQHGPLPLDQALQIAIETADALDAAHCAGIVHRDVKPANIALGKNGATLLDFGLAKRGAEMPAAVSTLPTEPALTAAGMMLGTVPYMAPEQVEGREADPRADIFAVGAVLYEMITGRKAFEAETQARLVSAILRDTPPPISNALRSDQSLLGSGGIQHLEYTINRCLAKDPNNRWQSARDLTLHLRWIAQAGSSIGAIGAAERRRRAVDVVSWAVAGVALVAAVAFGVSLFRGSTSAAGVIRFSIDPPIDSVFAPTNSISAPHPAISPDARNVAFLAQVGDEPVRLWIRPLDAVTARPLAGTDGAAFPFWSADSRLLGFFADGALKTIDPAGGAAHRVCDAPAAAGGTWNREGTILFAPGSGGLVRVAATGGATTQVTTPSLVRGSAPHQWPSFLPDGKRFVFHEGEVISIGSLDSHDVRVLAKADSQAAYAAPAYLLYMRGTTLLAQPFDATRGDLTGEPRPVAEGVSRAFSNAAFSVSLTGVLVYRSGRLVNRQLTWFDRSGNVVSTVGGVHDFNGVHLSPDERKAAYHRHDGRPDGDVWIVDLARGTSERFTLSAENNAPVWSPDGTRIVYNSNRDSSVNNLWIKSSSGAGAEAPLFTSSIDKSPRSWSADGAYLAYEAAGARGDIWILPLAGTRTPFAFLQTEFDEREPSFSPDGRWLAYRSDESGKNEVYVRPFPKGEGRLVISTNGGSLPQWRADGRELFYQANREIWAVPITPAAGGLDVGTPGRLFDIGVGGAGWDVTHDGQRFLVGRGVEQRAPGALTVTTNWTATLRK